MKAEVQKKPFQMNRNPLHLEALEEEDNNDRWLVSYADFITLLFAFFTVMYATAEKNTAKEKAFENSIKKSMAGSFHSSQGSEPGEFPIYEKSGSMVAPPIELQRRRKSNESWAQDLKKTLESEMKDAKNPLQAIEASDQGVRLILNSAILFKSGSADLQPTVEAKLNELVEKLKEYQKPLAIEGHTDNLPVRSDHFATNWELSAQRATTVVRYLIQNEKYPAELLSAAGYADQKPRTSNLTAAGRSKNRRIEFLLKVSE